MIRPDAVVVGAGLVGLAVAYELGRRGRRVLVLERDQPGAGASGVAAGMLAPTSEADLAERALVDFARDSRERYLAFVRDLERGTGLSCHYRDDGTLWVALTRDDAADLEHLAATLSAKGLAPRRLAGGDVLAREPHLSGRVRSGLWVPDDHQVDPRALVRALVAAVRSLGGEVLTGAPVNRIDADGGGVRAVLADRADGPIEVACQTVVLAAGAWSATAMETPLPDLGLRPVKGQILRLRGEPILEHVVRHPEVYLVPRRDGELVVGGTMEEQGFDAAPRAGAVLELLRAAWHVLPGVAELALAEVAVGFRPAVRDHLPVIGATETAGLFVATGHFRHGVLLAPATGHYLAELIVTGVAPAALGPFGVERLRRAEAPPPGRALARPAAGREG